MTSGYTNSAPQITRGIVLRTIKHTEGRLIVRTCTERFGTRGVVVRAGRKGTAQAALQPLSRVELVVVASEGRELLSAREVRIERPYMNLPTDPVRRALALFMQELLLHVLREEVADQDLFAMLEALMEELDTGADPAGYPLRAMVALLAYLGIHPDTGGSDEDVFDLREGRFRSGAPPHEHCMPAQRGRVFKALLAGSLEDVGAVVPYDLRQSLLNDLNTYYRLHVPGFGELRAPGVLHAVLA